LNERVTLCIIDDIPSVVEGLASAVDWASIGVEVVGTALDGKEGLALIREKRPDIVLTDIRMPNMDGIEMLDTLNRERIPSKAIFFSGYTDFEYARQAVRLGAFDYLTKPHSIPDILEIVAKAKERVLAERREQIRLIEIERRVKESLPILRQEFFTLLLHHAASEGAVRKRWAFLQIELPQTDLAVMMIEIDQFEKRCASLPIEEIELIRFSLQNILEETISSVTRGVVFRETMSRFAAVCHLPDGVDAADLAERCCEHVATYSKFTISIGVGRKATHASELHRSCQDARIALSYQFYTGGNVALLYDEVAGRGRVLPRYPKEKEQELGLALQSGNATKARETLADMLRELSSAEPRPEPAYLINVCKEIGFFAIRVLMESVPREETAELEHGLASARLEKASDLGELERILSDICERGCRIIERRRRSDSERIVDAAIRHIRANLREPLTLADCARHVHLSGNYFAGLFKRVTGMTFVQFVTNERIETAKRMLIEGRQVQEVALEVGYEDRRYFTSVFKKMTGLTPSAFVAEYKR